MPAEATQFAGKLIAFAPQLNGGQCAELEASAAPKPYQGAGFRVCTGGGNGLLADVTFNMPTPLTLIPASDVPTYRRVRPTRFDLSLHGNVGWAGGTAVIVQDTTGAPLAFFPLASLKSLAAYNLPNGGLNAPLTLAVSSYATATGVITFPASSLTSNSLAGYPFTVVAGTGRGQSGIIASTTTTTITPLTILPTALDSTSVVAVWYFVATAGAATSITASNASWTSNSFTNGWYVVIVGGTGAGQVRAITANTGTALTVATWDTNPSTDSVFLITNTPEQFGALDLSCGQHWAAAGLGAGLQVALQGTFTGSTSSPIRVYAEGFFGQ